MTQEVSTFPLTGGLDLVSAALGVAPSKLISGINYEPLAEGYGRVQGFERFDGRGAPSATLAYGFVFADGVTPLAEGAVVTGATSGATARLVADAMLTSGGWDAGTAAGSALAVDVSGQFLANENLTVGGLVRARLSLPPVLNDTPESVLLAREWRRGTVVKVPGIGPVRGVAVFGGEVFAWRDHDGVRARMWRGTANGWQEVGGGARIVRFNTGVREPFAGDIIRNNAGTATATVRRVVRQTGDWGSTATGFLVVGDIVGVFAHEALFIEAEAVANITSTESHTFAAGGRYMTTAHNFYGASGRASLYGVYGSGRAFEFDGVAVAPIESGMEDDRPTRVFEIANHLGLTFRGGSVQFSSLGQPLEWDPVTGAGEIGLGTEITDVVQSAETAVVLFGESKIAVLAGRDAASFELQELTEEAGAEPWTAQRLARTLYIDKRGLRDLSATQSFGNFKAGALSGLIEPYFRGKAAANVFPVLTYVSRTKSQYRIVYSDGTGLAIYMGRRDPEAIPFSLDDMRPFCVGSGELDDGEGIFIGAEDGYVYRMDSGPSFDGVPVRGFVMTPFNHFGAAMRDDRFHKVTLECQAQPETRIGVTVQFDYGDGQQPISGKRDFTVQGQGDGHDFVVSGGGGAWGTALWDRFFWSAPFQGVAAADIDGIGRNASFIFACDSGLLEEPHILQAYEVHRSPRRLRR